MKNFFLFLMMLCVGGLSACDLQPKIASIPDSVGDFISVRYPALLADPAGQPEIYNSAATDYGVYASPELYGSVSGDDYVLYASVSDYIIPPQAENTVGEQVTQNVETGGVKDDSDKDGGNVADNSGVSTQSDAEPVQPAPADDYLMVPMYGAFDITGGQTGADTVTVARGDTLYSIARANNTSIAELVRINKLESPSNLSVGQVLQIRDDKKPVTYVATQTKQIEAEKKAVAGSAGATSGETQNVVINKPVPTTTRVQLQEVTVEPGETLYSISRRYSVPVNDLAVMNDISAPFALRVGQVIKVPNLSSPAVRVATSVTPAGATTTAGVKVAENAIVVKTAPATVGMDVAGGVTKGGNVNPASAVNTNSDKKLADAKSVVNADKNKSATGVAKSEPAKKQKTETKKISSDPKQKLPKITARSSSKFSWPVRGKILSHFGAKSDGLFNDGINISATRGTAVGAAENGVVAYAGNEVKGMGNLVIIQHADGWMTVYAHMDSMAVRRGAKVGVGQKIGTVGATGRVDKPQLHFEVRKGTNAYNPVQYLKK